MAKFLKFEGLLVNQDGKKEDVGLVYIRSDDIGMIREIWDKHEVVIPDVVLISYRNGQSNLTVKGNIDDIVSKIEESSVYE